MTVNIKVKRDKSYNTEAYVSTISARESYNAARVIKKNIKLKAPVRTGHLRDSVNMIKQPDGTWLVYVGAYYGVYVEYGHRVHSAQGVQWVPAQPFFAPGIQNGRREWRERKRAE